MQLAGRSGSLLQGIYLTNAHYCRSKAMLALKLFNAEFRAVIASSSSIHLAGTFGSLLHKTYLKNAKYCKRQLDFCMQTIFAKAYAGNEKDFKDDISRKAWLFFA